MRDKRTHSAVPAKRRHDNLTPAERSLRARMAAHAMHARYDGRVTTANARAAFLARFEREVDPDGLLPPEERRRRATQARSAYFTRLSVRAADARRHRRQRAQQEQQETGGGAR